MSAIRNQPRSSKSIDYEDSVTFKELKEPNFAEKNYISPDDCHLPEKPASLLLSYSQGVNNDNATTYSGGGLRTNSAHEKITVFRDVDVSRKKDYKVGGACSTISQQWPSRIAQPQTTMATLTGMNQCPKSMKAVVREHTNKVCDQENMSTDDISSPTITIRKLQDIAASRRALLQQLDCLQEEENRLLAALATATSRQSMNENDPQDDMICKPVLSHRVSSISQKLLKQSSIMKKSSVPRSRLPLPKYA